MIFLLQLIHSLNNKRQKNKLKNKIKLAYFSTIPAKVPQQAVSVPFNLPDKLRHVVAFVALDIQVKRKVKNPSAACAPFFNQEMLALHN